MNKRLLLIALLVLALVGVGLGYYSFLMPHDPDGQGYYQPLYPGSPMCIAHGVPGIQDGYVEECPTPPLQGH